MSTLLVQADAFTDRPFSGNPAAVCLLDRPASDGWMQALAREMNLSETAFVQASQDGSFELRWFTPSTEVDLCGHATLASAHVLWEEDRVGAGPITFSTRSGDLVCRRAEPWIEMDFPSRPATVSPVPDGLEEALETPIRWCGRSAEDVLVEVHDEASVAALDPDLRAVGRVDARAVVVTAASDGEGDLVSRVFAPRVGIDEDPVTGSAHCTLAPFWAERTGRTELVGRQLSSRGGTVRMRLDGDRVVLGGHAVTVVRGTLATDAGPDAPGSGS